MKNHSGGSHNNHARPDEKINREYPKKSDIPEFPPTSEQTKALKRVAAKKRRQRSKLVIEEEVD